MAGADGVRWISLDAPVVKTDCTDCVNTSRLQNVYDQAIRVYDQSERKKFYSQIQKLIAAEQPYVFLWENESLFDINNRIVLPYAAGETKTSPIVDPWRWYSKTGQ